MSARYWITSLLAVLHFSCAPAQNSPSLRYFQFRIECGYGNWQDTAVVAATSDPGLIADFYEELRKPYDERKLINGPLAHGDGGHNRNGEHRFRWHFVPDAWELADLAFEACSGCPFTDLDADPVYWVDSLGTFCPWSARPVRELEGTTALVPEQPAVATRIYPNPARHFLTVDLPPSESRHALLRDPLGEVVVDAQLYGTGNRITVSGLPTGLYTLELTGAGRLRTQHKIFLQ